MKRRSLVVFDAAWVLATSYLYVRKSDLHLLGFLKWNRDLTTLFDEVM